jgi:hypothetical protein
VSARTADVLACAASLREFDVATIASLCDAEPAAVEAVLNAHRHVFVQRTARHARNAPVRWRVAEPKLLVDLLSDGAVHGDLAARAVAAPQPVVAARLQDAASILIAAAAFFEESEEGSRRSAALRLEQRVRCWLDAIEDGAGTDYELVDLDGHEILGIDLDAGAERDLRQRSDGGTDRMSDRLH